MKVLLLNQFGNGSEAPTGRLAAELAEFLNLHGHTAQVISSDDSYKIKRTRWRRWAHELRSHWVLFFRALKSGRADAVISFTSPVCLPVTARLVATLLTAKLYLWNMDIYPELALVLLELRPGLVASTLRALMRSAYTSAAGVIALDDDMREFFKETYGVESSVIPPWPPSLPWPNLSPCLSYKNKTWLYSGNLGQAHEIQVLLKIQKRLEADGADIQLVLQGAGAQWSISQDIAKGMELRNVLWRNPALDSELTESLLRADVLVVTRKPETKGLLWPSKLALAQLSRRPVLWIGDTDSWTGREVKKEPQNAAFLPGQEEEIFNWLKKTLSADFICSPAPIPTEASRQEYLQRWLALLSNL